MRRHFSSFTSALALVAFVLFLWMFFAAATLERTADLGGIWGPPEKEIRTLAYQFAAQWRHGMAGNSPIYMPGFFAVAIAIWFWCSGKGLPRMLGEGAMLIGTASLCAALLAPLAAPRILKAFAVQEGFTASDATPSVTWVAYAQGIYSLLTWTTVIIAARFSITLRSPKPLLIPLTLNVVLALVRPWTVADFTSRWMRQAYDGEAIAVISLLLVPLMSGLFAWIEIRNPRKRDWDRGRPRPPVAHKRLNG